MRVGTPEIILRIAVELHLEYGLLTVVYGGVKVVSIVALCQVIAQGSHLVAQVNHILVV